MSLILKGTSGRTRTLFSGALTLPGANEYAVILDTTKPYPDADQSAPPKLSAIPTTPTATGRALGRSYGVLINCTTQDVTLQKYHLGADGLWKLKAAGTTITAGAAPQSLGLWDPSADGSQDALIVALAGGTPPGAIYVTLTERTLP